MSKANAASSALRNKQGKLQLYRKREKKWKDYIFKVTGNMYLHYFKPKNLSSPKEQVFLSTIKKVEALYQSPKGGEFVFQIDHGSKSSPWIINASSFEEQVQWMEVIQPGSGAKVKNVEPLLQKPMPGTATTTTTSSSATRRLSFEGNKPEQTKLSDVPRSCSYSGFGEYSTSGNAYVAPWDINPPSHPAKQSSPMKPTNYLKPDHQNGADEDEYVCMQGHSLNLIKEEDNEYVIMSTPKAQPSAYAEPARYCPIADDECSQVVQELQQKFTKDQIYALTQILQKVQIRSGDTTTPSKNLSRLVSKTNGTLSDSFLAYKDDESAGEKPKWARAVSTEEFISCPVSPEKSFDTINCISYNCIVNSTRIGEGNFGEVYKADYIPEGASPESAIPVAVKTTKAVCSEAEKKEFLHEMAVMSNMIHHPNIVRLYGVVTENVPSHWIVLEYLPHGDLKSYLCKSEKKSHETLVKYMVDVAMGMHYIADSGLVHRDLAARNVLVGENELCKVADFGLLRKLPQDDSIYQSTSNMPCPIRWMAPESLASRQFSVASDVWSYGILLWEILQPTKLPYERMSNIQVAAEVPKGYRIPIPASCSSVVSRVIKACLNVDPAKRPSFLVIVSFLTTKFASLANNNPFNDE